MQDQSFPTPIVTTDAVVLTLEDGVLQLLTLRRAQPPFAGVAALPGGISGHRLTHGCSVLLTEVPKQCGAAAQAACAATRH